MGAPSLDTLSPEQLDALREIIAEHDRGHKVENVFDLSKPPKIPYVYKEYDKMMYRADGHIITVKNAQQEEAKREEGYVNQPFAEFDYSRINRNGMKAARWADDEPEIQPEVPAFDPIRNQKRRKGN